MFYSGGSTVKQISISVHTPKRELRLTSWDFHLIDGTRRVAGRSRGAERSAIFVREVEAFVTAIRESNPSLIRSLVADAMRTQRVIDLIPVGPLANRLPGRAVQPYSPSAYVR